MQVISETLNSERSIASATDEDIQQVDDLISKWEVLETLAVERSAQSRHLGSMYKQILVCQSVQKEWAQTLENSYFEDVEEFKDLIQSLQGSKGEMLQHKSKLNDLTGEVNLFDQQNPTIRMARFHQEAAKLRSSLDKLTQKSSSRVAELQSLLMSWYDYNETHRELTYLLQQEQQQLRCLLLADEIVGLPTQDVTDTLGDIKSLQGDFSFYESKLESLTKLYSDMKPLLEEKVSSDIEQQLGEISVHMSAVKHSCASLQMSLEEKAAASGSEDTDGPAGAGAAEATDAGVGEASAAYASSSAQTQSSVPELRRQPLLRRLCKAAIPLLLLALGIALIVDPSDPEGISNFGLVFSPQLRYVRGPPPM